ncbi:MAG: anti-sigma factor [Nocardioidaceae bacterium]|nr:anti-sigma factor [Nocardioidaceae bacterium]
MEHPDAEVLAGAAIGDHLPDEVAAHVVGCAWCADEVRSLATVATRLRASTHVPVGPPVRPEVWQAVAEATAPVAPVEPAASARRRVPVAARLVAAAVVGAVVGGGTVLAATGGGSETPPTAPSPTATVLARAEVTPIGGASTTGSAALVRTSGGPVLDLDLVALGDVPADHYVEAWLFDPATLDMVSVGVVAGDRARLAVPADLDLATYSSVDLSLEPLDADPAHTTSIAQGDLR